MRVSMASLKTVLQNNVCEIKFARRRPAPGKSAFRRMFCTNAGAVLNSVNGRVTLNFRPTSRPPTFNPNQKNLVIVWDIFMQDYRCVNCDSCDLITSIPAGPAFWDYFRKNLMKLTPAQKLAFMNS